MDRLAECGTTGRRALVTIVSILGAMERFVRFLPPHLASPPFHGGEGLSDVKLLFLIPLPLQGGEVR